MTSLADVLQSQSNCLSIPAIETCRRPEFTRDNPSRRIPVRMFASLELQFRVPFSRRKGSLRNPSDRFPYLLKSNKAWSRQRSIQFLAMSRVGHNFHRYQPSSARSTVWMEQSCGGSHPIRPWQSHSKSGFETGRQHHLSIRASMFISETQRLQSGLAAPQGLDCALFVKVIESALCRLHDQD